MDRRRQRLVKVFLTYRSPKYLVMNLVTNLVITKLGEEFGDIFVTLFGDSPTWVMIFMTFSPPHLVGHQIGWWFWWQICWFAKFADIFGDEYGDEFRNKVGDKKVIKRSSNLSTTFFESPNSSPNLSPKSSPNSVTHQISCTFHHAIAKAAGQILPSLFKKVPGRTPGVW